MTFVELCSCARTTGAAVAAGAMACVFTGAASAETPSEWHVTPYLWAAGFEGSVGAPDGDSGPAGDADFKFDNLWDNVRLGGAMLNVNWRRGRWSAFGDWTYASVKSDSATRVPALYESVEGKIAGHIVQAFTGYDLLILEGSHLDLFGGVRYFNLDVTIDLAGAAVPDTSADGNQQWADAVVGGRWVTQFAGNWQAYVQADAGTGGSRLSWQAIGSVGYQYGWGSVVGGWRYLKADYDSGSYRLDAALSGPFVGAMWAF